MIVVDASVLLPALADDGRDGDVARARLQTEVDIAERYGMSRYRPRLQTGGRDHEQKQPRSTPSTQREGLLLSSSHGGQW